MNGRVNALFTIGASPINIWTQLSGTQMAGFGRLAPCLCRSLSIQVQPSAAGLVYVMDGAYGVQTDGISPRIPSKANSADVTATLGASTAATQPGSQYSDNYTLDNSQGGIDVAVCWIDGGNAGDLVRVSYFILENKL